MDKFEEIKNLIEDNSEILNFAEYGDGVSDEEILSAERRLNVVFPPSYIWWLKHYFGGEIYGDEIFSIYNSEDEDIPGGDIVYINKLDRKNGFINSTQLSIMSNDVGETFFFDLLKIDENGEAPVYKLPSNEKYANDFLDFLKKQILEKYL
ncbi:SMI1/KNR4 family protein [Pedobacter sp. ISL-68]|uniref:SMI1/KNR4 family protein n=1 Tax=unclassified Pedobacter TaxID=2628915 RepID=UPI001BE8A838|nr:MULTISPECIES: SMI1/KNR4 family protein [unclassified Pedobacter]MBT2563777.1 SMI1/KNR4 family protein [Pedobacter sp. ISL-64]MBT2592817.1 SMI1/KNR4 family protein [Pedobacter sp. ISL-68]